MHYVDLTLEPVFNRDYRPDLESLVPVLDDEAAPKEQPKKAPAKKPPTTPTAAAPFVDPVALATSLVQQVLKGAGNPTVDAEIHATLMADVTAQLRSLKNAAYAAGFADSKVAARAAVGREWA